MFAEIELSKRISRIRVSETMRTAQSAARLKARGVDIVDLSAGEPDFPTPENIKRAAIRAIEENFTRYTAAGGTDELKEAVCQQHAKEFGTSYTTSECVICCGGKHAIFNTVQVLVDKGDEVIIPVPYWVTYADVVRYAGGIPIFIPTDEDSGFSLTASMVERHITQKTRVVIINSPCNPSGAVVDPEEFSKIYRATSQRDIWLLTDECYAHLVYDGKPFSIASLPGARRTVIVAGSVSKTYSMTGWRVGYALAPAKVASAIAVLQSQSTSNPNSIAQKAAVEALVGAQESVMDMLAEYRKRRDFVVERLRAIPGVQCREPKGAFYAYPNIRCALGRPQCEDTTQFAQRLLDEGRVAVVPGEAFGTTDHIRISFAASMKELDRGLARIHDFIGKVLV